MSLWPTSEMVIAPGECQRRARIDPRRRVRILRQWRNGQSTDTADSTDRSAVGESASGGKTKVTVV